jgi:predicted phosphodiesterase
MRLGFIADIHANLEALQITLELLKREAADKIFCLGDIVGYNANPKECIDLLIANHIPSISGNHDRFVSGAIDAVIRPETAQVIEYTKAILNEEQMDFISSLPDELYFEDIFLCVHGSPRHKDEYVNALQIAKSNLQIIKQERPWVAICFYGHTHLPYIIADNHIETDIHQNTTFQLERRYTYLINPGSVGQPRDRCPLSSCVVFDTEKFMVSYFRSEYDIETTQKKILAAGLSKKLADRLAQGR